jgi:drug/metabolite transporter (DMT)-like permease
MVMRGRLRDWVLLVFCNLIWGSQFVMYKIVQRQVGPIFASLFPITCATLFLIPFVYRHKPKERSAYNRRETLMYDVFRFVVIGVCGQVVAQLGMASGTRLTPASNAALISLMLPIATAFMAYLILGERMTLTRWIGFALAIVGVIECSGIQWNRLNATDSKVLLGNIIVFCAISGSAFYNVYSKKLLLRYSPLQVLCYSYCVVIVLMLPVAVYTEPQSFKNIPGFTASVWAGFLILAFFQYFLAMVVFLSTLTRLEATQAGLSNYLIPFFGVLIAAFVLHERLTSHIVFGGLMVLVATVIVTGSDSGRRVQSI